MNDYIKVVGARVNNLKNVSVTLPRNKLIVMTGLSGSGKSSLAFDTLYAEGQRRYVESLSAYARQFLGQMDKPDVDSIEGLSPAISIDQKTTSHNPRSTVGTVTEIHDYLRLLYANIGTPHCPICGKEISQQTVDQIIDQVTKLPERTRVYILAPLIRGRKGEYVKLIDDLPKQGFVRVRIDGEIYDIGEQPQLDKNKKHTIEVVVDRLIIRDGIQQRLTDSLETAMKLAGGLVVVGIQDGEDMMFSQNYACPDCGISLEELTPRMFSFNNPYGACPTCSGLGVLTRVDPATVIKDTSLSFNQGALSVSGWRSGDDGGSMAKAYLDAVSKQYGFSLDTPVKDLTEEQLNAVLYGTGNQKLKIEYTSDRGKSSFTAPFEGILPNLTRRYNTASSQNAKEELSQYMAELPCPECHGERLRKEARAVTVCDMSISKLSDLPINEAREKLHSLVLTEKQAAIARQILKELEARLGFLVDVGLDYLTLSRSSGTLSGGEAQRIRLATQIGSALTGVLYILDEPSIGLHQKDNQKLLATLKRLRDIGNTVIVVEHDTETMLSSDYLVDIGPGAGCHGGEITACGTPEEVMNNPASLTGQYLSGKRVVPMPTMRRSASGTITVRGARAHNLKNINVTFPLGVITCVTGVSGSGKSSLVNEILYKALSRTLNRSQEHPGEHDGIDGTDRLDKIIAIDQTPIGRTPRSNPATYTGIFDLIRDVFAATPDARARGYKNARFSFNVKGGRCEACSGDGIVKIEMHFLPDVYVPCDVCKGKRYNRETLEVRYKGKSIHDVLEMTCEEALVFFSAIPKIAVKLQTLVDVGLGYLKLGQPSTTLSGGEAQRIKLATELSRKATGRTIYLLDEPTTGLHMEDVARLNAILQKLADGGNTLIVIEHNLDVIKTADYIIDMGPDGGNRGGTVIACGTPEEVAKCENSYTGQFLDKILNP